MSWYLDSSAILKLLIAEKESAALTGFINFTIKSSALTRVEVIRTLYKIAPERVADAKVILAGIDTTPVNTSVLNTAENFNPSITLRSLDAIHVATVLFLAKLLKGSSPTTNKWLQTLKSLELKLFHQE